MTHDSVHTFTKNDANSDVIRDENYYDYVACFTTVSAIVIGLAFSALFIANNQGTPFCRV
jgi:hypothetical protein